MRQKSRRETGSTPLVGSSRKRTCGVWISAQASPSFCFMPPERLPASLFLKGVRLLKARRRSIFSSRSRLRDAVDIGIEMDVFHDGQIGVEAEALAHVADLRLDRLGLPPGVVADHPGLPVGSVHDPGQHPQVVVFPAPSEPTRPNSSPFATVSAETVHGGEVTEALGEIVGFDGRKGRTHFPVASPWYQRPRSRFPSIRPRSPVPIKISASAGMPGFSSRSGLGRVILIR